MNIAWNNRNLYIPSIPTISILFIRLFFVYNEGRIRFPDTDRQQSSGTQDPFALRFRGYTVQISYETSDVHVWWISQILSEFILLFFTQRMSVKTCLFANKQVHDFCKASLRWTNFPRYKQQQHFFKIQSYQTDPVFNSPNIFILIFGAPNGAFFQNTLKTLFRLSRVLLDL